MVQVLQVMRRRHRHRDLRILSRAVRMQADRAAKEGAVVPGSKHQPPAYAAAADRRQAKSTVTKPRARSRFDTLSHPLMVDSPMMHGGMFDGEPKADVEAAGDQGTTADGDVELDNFEESPDRRRKD